MVKNKGRFKRRILGHGLFVAVYHGVRLILLICRKSRHDGRQHGGKQHQHSKQRDSLFHDPVHKAPPHSFTAAEAGSFCSFSRVTMD